MDMPAERIVIVGAGPAGLATARSYREHGGHGEVTLVGAEPVLPYQRPPLSKEFLRGEIDADALTIEQESWFREHDVQLRLGVTASAIDPEHGIVTLAPAERLRADTIVLATGSHPVRAELSGANHPAVLTLRTLADSERLAERGAAGARLLVIGTGFIGCEIAASLSIRGCSVTLLGQERLPQLERLGEDAARRIAHWLEDLGVELVLSRDVRAIYGGRVVELDDGPLWEGAGVVLGTGVRPCGRLAKSAGLRLRDGAVMVDSQMRSAANVLAVGDVACAENASLGSHLRVEHWGDALEHGAVAGRTLAGIDARWEGVPGFWSTIGTRTIKYAAWSDGYDEALLRTHAGEAFTVWYSRDGVAVGVLTHECDADYERGRGLIARGEPVP